MYDRNEPYREHRKALHDILQFSKRFLSFCSWGLVRYLRFLYLLPSVVFLTSGSYSVLLFSLFSWSIVKCCLIPRYHIVAGFLIWYGGIGPVNCCCITCCCCSILLPNHGTVHMPDPSQKGSLSFEFLQFH